MTGGRGQKIKKIFKWSFLLTYGDGLSNINLNKLIKFHKEIKNDHLNCCSPSS